MTQIERYITARDDRVCQRCWPHHNMLFVKGSGPRPPLHGRCRCKRIPVAQSDLPQPVLADIGIRAKKALAAELKKTGKPADLRQAVGKALEQSLAADRNRTRDALMLAAAAGAAYTAIQIAEEIERRRRDR